MVILVNLAQHVKFLTFVSTVSMLLICGIVLLSGNFNLAIVTGVAADVIQIVTYVAWLLQKEVNLSQIPEQVREIHTIVKQERDESRVTAEIVARLVREGVVREDELLSLIRHKEIMIAFPYAESLTGQRIRKIAEKGPLKRMLEEIGFVSATIQQNLMVAIADSLPPSLRDVDNLNAFIKRELPREWTRISEEVRRRYPPEEFQILEKYRTGEGFKVSYILAKSMAMNFLIDYMKKNSFTTKFQMHIAGQIDRNQLKRMLKVRRHEVKKIVSKISIELLLSDIPQRLKEQVVRCEDEIKGTLGIKIITDYRLLDPRSVANALHKSLPDAEEPLLQSCSTRIVEESQKCYDSLNRLGIHLT